MDCKHLVAIAVGRCRGAVVLAAADAVEGEGEAGRERERS